jgi:porphobilinogen synthase
VDCLAESVARAGDLGIGAVILSGIPEAKDAEGLVALERDGIVPRALEAVAKRAPAVLRVADLCFCEYTTHGHCGPVDDQGRVVNDATIRLLGRQARVLADAGAQVIAPSGMMDGMVGAIRAALDDGRHQGVPILSYAAKYASGFYGPFREAAGSAPAFGDRRAYQMDPAKGDEALREVALDLDEGADMVMVKPALPCLDIIRRVKDRFGVPTAAYQVSGEYAMIKAAAQNGWIDHDRVMEESLVAIRRAGADFILTYFATEIAPRLAP